MTRIELGKRLYFPYMSYIYYPMLILYFISTVYVTAKLLHPESLAATLFPILFLLIFAFLASRIPSTQLKIYENGIKLKSIIYTKGNPYAKRKIFTKVNIVPFYGWKAIPYSKIKKVAILCLHTNWFVVGQHAVFFHLDSKGNDEFFLAHTQRNLFIFKHEVKMLNKKIPIEKEQIA